jgi:S1-C subfamily serine protease
MNLIKTSSIFLVIFIVGCGSSTHFIQPSINIEGFRYVYIAPMKYQDGMEDKYGLGSKLASMFINKGLQLMNDYDLKGLSSTEKFQVLFCNLQHFTQSEQQFLYGRWYNTYKSTVNLNLYDIFQRKVFSGKGEMNGGIWMTSEATLEGALDESFKGFAENYSRFNKNLALNPLTEVKKRYGNWETLNLDENQLKNYYDNNLENLYGIEGIWSEAENKQYRIGILKDSTNPKRDFVAIILKSESPFWLPRQVKIELQKTAYKGTYSTTYYMEDHSKQGTTAFINDKGLLEIKLKDPNDNTKPLDMYFIKNYPFNVEKSQVGKQDISIKKVESTGSGFLISRNGLIITNFHVIENSTKIEVIFPDMKIIKNASIRIKDSKNDIAILEINNFSLSDIINQEVPFTFADVNSVKIGQEIFTLGFPLGDILGTKSRLSLGTINSLYGLQDDPRLYQISNPLQPGNSGGPLFNRKGELVGIVVSSLNAKFFYENVGILPQNVNFAIKSTYLQNLISMLPESDEILKRKNSVKLTALEEQVEQLSPFIVQIRVY